MFKLTQFLCESRVINAWNRLPEQIIAATTVNGFKNTIDRHFRVSMTLSLTPYAAIKGVAAVINRYKLKIPDIPDLQVLLYRKSQSHLDGPSSAAWHQVVI